MIESITTKSFNRFIPVITLLFSVLSLSALSQTVQAGQIISDIHFTSPTIESHDGFHRVTMSGSYNIERAGAPSLPSKDVWTLLPPGENATSFRLSNVQWETVPGEYLIEPAQQSYRMNDPIVTMTPPDPQIYLNDAPFPAEQVSGLASHIKKGVSLASCIVHPVRWNPSDGSLEYIISAKLTVSTGSDEQSEESYSNFYRGDRETFEWVADKVVNPEGLGQYPRRDVPDVRPMLIVTGDALVEVALEYANWHNTRGTPTYVETVESYLQTQNGVDDEEKIRAGIANAYSVLGVDYLLLLGDVDIIPDRGLFGSVAWDNEDSTDQAEHIPADFYYAALDGNWNADGDTLWGEPDEADLLSEMAVGRIPADNVEEAMRMFRKVRMYSDEPVVDDALRVLSVGEDLGWNVWGGDYMDEVYGGAQTWGHFTLGYPNRFHYFHRTLYDRNDYWDPMADLAPAISEGYQFIHHVGHANQTYVMKFNIGNISDETITNDGVTQGFNIAYSQGCDPGDFEVECIAEKFTVQINNGFVAFVANSRSGWGSTNNTNGASQHYHREFVDALMGEGITTIGRVQEDSKEDLAGWFNNGTLMRWCYYTSNLFGDPSMDMWTDVPIAMEPEFHIVIPINDETFEVTVPETPNATVCLSRDGEIISIGFTDEQGVAVLDIPEPILPTGQVTLSVVAHNRIPYQSAIYSISDSEGFPWVEELTINDAGGVEDGKANPGETVEVNISLHNLGNVPLDGLFVTAETEYPAVRIVRGRVGFDRVVPDGVRLPNEPFVLEIDTTSGDLHGVLLHLTLEDNSGLVWNQDVSFSTHAPVLSGRYLTVLDNDGNHNGRLDPGEEAEVLFSVINNGSGVASNVFAKLHSGNPYVEVLEDESRLDIVEANGVADFNLSFRARVSDDCPDPYRAILYIRLIGDRGLAITHLLDVPIGGTFYNFERNPEEWTHEPIQRQYADQWHLTRWDNHSYGGSYSLKAGHAQPGEPYTDMLNSAIYMPEFYLEQPLELAFWHKIDADFSLNYEGFAYDGGWLEVRLDHRGWNTIYPGGAEGEPHYPYEVRHGGRNPTPEGQGCFSGHHDWAQAFYDLSEFVGHDVEIRFRFSSDEGIGSEGWLIDDIELRLPSSRLAPTELSGEAVPEGVMLSWGSPVVPRRDEKYHIPDELSGYRIYRQSGQGQFFMLDTLVTDDRFVDDLSELPDGEFAYYVSAEYVTGESDPSDTIEVNWANDIADQSETLPTEWQIVSTWPNPFNSLTRIAYNVPVQGNVNISIYDVHGRQLLELTNSVQQPGRHEITFNALDYPSGMYLVRMGTPVGSRTAKLLLIR